jgi:hypothetical protein
VLQLMCDLTMLLYLPPDIRMINARKMRWTGHGTHGREDTCIQNFSRRI